MTTYRIAIRRDLASAWTAADPTLAQGEFGYETDTGKIKIGDGTSSWGTLPYHSGIDGSSSIQAGDLDTINDLVVGGSLTVNGPQTTLNTDTDIDGTLGVTGDVVFHSHLGVTSNITTDGFRVGGPGGPQWDTGTGSPEGVWVAPVGSIYSQVNATGHDALWVKEVGAGGTGWHKVTTTVVTRSSGTIKVI